MPIKIQDISAQLPNTGSNGTRPLKNIRYAVVHHSAVVSDDKYDPIARYKAEANGHIAKGWKRLGYHYTISRQGTVYLCNPEKEVT